MNRRLRTLAYAIFFILALHTVSATEFSGSSATSAQYSNPGAIRPSFENYYPSGGFLGFDTFYPQIEGKDICVGRQDIILRIPTAGCQPAVVRSDLLAEQNVPVFCQIEAIKVNPLIDITRIRGIHFDSNKPSEVADVGFHPSRVALNSREKLLGSPIDRNIGYVVVVLKRNEIEKSLPDFVNINLTAKISYDAANTIGIGRAEFILSPVSDEEWEGGEKLKQSFWNGRYYARLLEAGADYADVAIYYGDRLITQTRIVKGKPSGEIYLPGGRCDAGLQIEYTGFVGAKNKARLELSDSSGATDVFDVYEGSDFLDGKCNVRDIDISENMGTGSVSIDCFGKRILLKLGLNFPQFGGNRPIFDNIINVTYVNLGDITYGVNKEGKLVIYDIDSGAYNEVEGYTYGENKKDGRGRELDGVRDGLISYHNSLFKSSVKIDKPDYETGEIERAVDEAIGAYERIVEEHPNTLIGEGSSTYYGEQALKEAIDLAISSGRGDEVSRLTNKLIEKYPQSQNIENYREKLDEIALVNIDYASDTVYFAGKYRTIKLMGLSLPEEKSSATFVSDRNEEVVKEEDIGNLTWNGQKVGEFKVLNVNSESVTIAPKCFARDNNGKIQGGYGLKDLGRVNLNIKSERAIDMCGTQIMLKDIDMRKVAMIRLNPLARGPETVANLSVNIGIEKRLIQLAPEKSLEKIKRLNETIQKWENIAINLEKVVKGMKGACFATAAILTVKNFVTGLSGEGLARQEVMRGDKGWTERCLKMVERGEKGYENLNACYLGESENINRDVEAYKNAINEVNDNIKANEVIYEKEGFLGDKSVNRDVSVANYRKYLIEKYKGEKVEVNGKEVSVEKILENERGYDDAEYTYEQLREMELNLILKKKNLDGVSNDAEDKLESIFSRIEDNQALNEKLKQSSGISARAPMEVSADNQRTSSGNVIPINRVNEKLVGALKGDIGSEKVTDVVFIRVKPGTQGASASGAQSLDYLQSGVYAAGLEMDSQGNYLTRSIVEVNDSEAPLRVLDKNEKNEFLGTLKIGAISPESKTTYNNKYLNPKVRYYETEPYKGMPALVPFDIQRGWYAATRQTLPAFGAVSAGAFESSGRVSNFWLCNVGSNGREQFNEGMGDDKCQEFNVYADQPPVFEGINNPAEVRALVERARRALEEAARQYGQKEVVINGFKINDVTAAANIPSVQCQDFMDPKDCYAMFNVCDPVICPASRCNLGGTYQVADVIQSGIVGSTLLCLPNIKEKIAIPVCLTGIHAGIDSYVSILKSYRGCLQESVDTGKVVGICDQITSIYMCEFFWRQAAPAANVILPKLVDSIYRGQTARGGGEYLTVQGAWNNMQNSVNYFKDTYAVNSLKAFQIRSVEEVGTPFCKAFISAKAPTKFKSLIEPDSPPQFHAWFSSIKLNDATIHPFDQYKVFYHIFAGKDSGVSYRVYLKNPPQTAYVAVPLEYTIASNFIPAGEYKTETKDLAAPSGYKELCVSINGEENCGFKQVSSSFAVNYVRDKYVQGELERKDIKSERGCVSGGVAPAAILANTNPQFAVEEAMLGEDYKRGIVRICSTGNPGISTDPGRFIDVGYCDDSEIRCWLDKKSIDRAITPGNELIKESSLKELEEGQLKVLERNGEILTEIEANGKIKEFKDILISLDKVFNEKGIEALESSVRGLANEIEGVLIKTTFSKQKAQLLAIKAQALDKLARGKINKEKAGADRKLPDKKPAQPAIDTPDSSTVSSTSEFTLEDTGEGYNPDERNHNILLGGLETGLYISANQVYKVKESNDEAVGEVQLFNDKYRINIFDDKKEEVLPLYYNGLNGAFIEPSSEGVDARIRRAETPQPISQQTPQSTLEFTLEGTEQGLLNDRDMNILYGGKKTNIYMKYAGSGYTLYVSNEPEEVFLGYARIASNTDMRYKIVLLSDKKDKITDFYYKELNGAFIESPGDDTKGRNLKVKRD